MKKGTLDIPTHLLEIRESRYTARGLFLRKYSLDELAQLVNIMKGEMFFIGPRPALYNQEDLIQLRTEAGVHELTPGVTGWAQINGRDTLTIQEKVKMDEYYLINKSFLLNLKILFMTIFKVIRSENNSR